MMLEIAVEASMLPVLAEIEPVMVEATVAKVIEADLLIEIELVGEVAFLIDLRRL